MERASGQVYWTRRAGLGLCLLLLTQSPRSQGADTLRLSVSRTPTNTLVVSWPTNSGGYVFQANSTLRSTNWANLLVTPSLPGGAGQAIVAPSATTQFYRLRYAPGVGATASWGNISVGKFYSYSAQPSSSYPDVWPVVCNGARYSDGTKLTDENWNSTGPTDDLWCGWSNTTVTVTLDLGQNQSVSDMRLHACTQTSGGIYYPSATLWYSPDGTNYTQYGEILSFPGNSSAFSQATASNYGWVNARFVQLRFWTGTNCWTLINELWVNGSIPNLAKLVPSGCYLGCYHVTSQGYLDIEGFETKASREVKLALWYADWSGTFTNEIGSVIDWDYQSNRVHGARWPELGWLPYNTTSDQIASGGSDSYLQTWFLACAAKNYPIWLRPMNEMNGSWTWLGNPTSLQYGGHPQSYRWAWRRMYNIAEKVGCTGTNQVFVWSPDAAGDLAGGGGNGSLADMTRYYPGDQYTDWVGASVYSDGAWDFYTLVSRWYGLYSANKPLIISEGGCTERSGDPNWKGYTFMSQWFYDCQYVTPAIRAACWFDSGVYAIDTTTNSLGYYRAFDQNPYYLSE